MGIKHIAVKASGDIGLASEWNDEHTIDGDVDFGQYEALRFVFNSLAAPPAGPADGQVYYDTTLNLVRCWNGSSWQPLTDLTTTNGFLGNGESYDIDLGTSDAKLKESATNLIAGTYLVLGGINTDLYRFTAGWAGVQIWLEHGSTIIDGSVRKMHLKLDANAEKVVGLQTAIIYIFSGTEKVSLHAQMIGGGELAYCHSTSLVWIRIG